jgi:nicotinamidase-related amidase
MNRQALLVVDMLHDFMHPEGALFCGPESLAIIPRIKALIEEKRRAASLIIFVQDSHPPDDKEFRRFPPHCLAGQPGSAIIPDLALKPGDIIVPKRRFSAFFETGLDEILSAAGVEEVHLCGVCTSICVMDTCSDLRNRDYEVKVHCQAVADFDPRAHEFALGRMSAILGAELV